MSRHVIIEFNRMPAIAGRMRAQASRIVRETAFEIEADIKEQMAGAKSGRIYGAHQASAPGEAPAIDTGALVNSIQTDAKPGSLTATVYTPMEHAPHLEYGTVNMEPRPSFTPAAERARSRFTNRMRTMPGRLR